ncbi:MAG: GNAT family N-acetyltransferase [Nitrospirota bacterium]
MTGLSVECVGEEADFRNLSDEWRRVVAESDADSLFVTWEWLSTWQRHFGSDGRLFVLCARDADGALIGFAPLRIVRHRSAGGAGLRVLEWLGSGSPVWSDALDVVSRRGREGEVHDAVGTELLRRRNEWDAARLTDVSDGSRTGSAFAEIFQAAGLRGNTQPCAVCPYLRLDQPWAVYEERAHRKFRDLKKYVKALDAAGAEFGVVQSPDVLECAVDALVRLNRERVLSKDGAPSLGNERFCRFVAEITRIALQGGWLRLYYVAVGGEFIALNLNFVHGSRVYGYLSGFNPEWQRRGVGTCLFRHAIRDSWEGGLKVYDFLRGDEAYKYRWTSDERKSISLHVINHRGRYALFQTSDFAERALKKIWRSAQGVLQGST